MPPFNTETSKDLTRSAGGVAKPHKEHENRVLINKSYLKISSLCPLISTVPHNNANGHQIIHSHYRCNYPQPTSDSRLNTLDADQKPGLFNHMEYWKNRNGLNEDDYTF